MFRTIPLRFLDDQAQHTFNELRREAQIVGPTSRPVDHSPLLGPIFERPSASDLRIEHLAHILLPSEQQQQDRSVYPSNALPK